MWNCPKENIITFSLFFFWIMHSCIETLKSWYNFICIRQMRRYLLTYLFLLLYILQSNISIYSHILFLCFLFVLLFYIFFCIYNNTFSTQCRSWKAQHIKQQYIIMVFSFEHHIRIWFAYHIAPYDAYE